MVMFCTLDTFLCSFCLIVGGSHQNDEERLPELQTALLKLPKVHLVVLDAIIEHFRMYAFCFDMTYRLSPVLVSSTRPRLMNPRRFMLRNLAFQ